MEITAKGPNALSALSGDGVVVLGEGDEDVASIVDLWEGGNGEG